MLILTDSKGTPLAASEPIAGNHNDAYELSGHLRKMLDDIDKSDISTAGLFLNADARFDTKDFREYCLSKDIIGNIAINPRNGNYEENLFDELLYKCRFVIERTNAWLDAFKILLVSFETNQIHWKALHFIAFTVILSRQL